MFDHYALILNLVFNFMSLLRDVSVVFYEKEKKKRMRSNMLISDVPQIRSLFFKRMSIFSQSISCAYLAARKLDKRT